jgi:hypothetical protein
MRLLTVWPCAVLLFCTIQPASAAPDRCANVLKILHSRMEDLTGDKQSFRQLPVLAPGHRRALVLDLTMTRRDGVFVGRYQVDGVPVLRWHAVAVIAG